MTNVPVDPTAISPANPPTYSLPDFYADPVGPFQVPRERAHAFNIQVREMDCSEAERDVLLNAMQRGYLVDTTRKPRDYGRTRVSTLWRRTCLQLKIPFIRFLPRKRYSPVELDLDYAHKCIHFDFREKLTRALQGYELQQHNPKNAQGPTLWSLSQIRLDKIDEVADLLLDAAVNHVLTSEECSVMMEEKLRREQEDSEQGGMDVGGPDDPDPLAMW